MIYFYNKQKKISKELTLYLGKEQRKSHVIYRFDTEFVYEESGGDGNIEWKIKNRSFTFVCVVSFQRQSSN